MPSMGTQQQLFADVGYYRGVLVALKHIQKEHMQVTRTVLLEFNAVSAVSFTLQSGKLVFFHTMSYS